VFFFGKEEYFIWASVSDAMPGAGAAQEKKEQWQHKLNVAW